MSANGIILSGIIERHALSVANGISQKCSGVITHKRITKIGIQESAIDLVLISSDMVEHLVSMHIDEEKKRVLTSFTNSKNGMIKHKSDHNSIETEFSIEWKEKTETKTKEIFNFKDKEGLKKFREMTENNKKLSSIFDSD